MTSNAHSETTKSVYLLCALQRCRFSVTSDYITQGPFSGADSRMIARFLALITSELEGGKGVVYLEINRKLRTKGT